MAVKIKLKRMGKIHAPFYRIIVADARTKRDGRAIEEIGKYHPMNDPSFIEVDSERAQHWLSVGAQPTDPVRKILEITGDWQKFKGLPGAEGTLRTAAPKPDKKDAYAAAVAEVHGLSDAAKGKGRKPAGKGADDQAEAEAKSAKPAGRSGGKQAAGKTTAKAETPKVETPKAETPKAETPKAETPKAETATAETAKADDGQRLRRRRLLPRWLRRKRLLPRWLRRKRLLPRWLRRKRLLPRWLRRKRLRRGGCAGSGCAEAAAPEAVAPRRLRRKRLSPRRLRRKRLCRGGCAGSGCAGSGCAGSGCCRGGCG